MQTKKIAAFAVFGPKAFGRRRMWESGRHHCSVYAFEPGQQNRIHRHPASEEVMVCWSGEGVMAVGDEAIPIRSGDSVAVPPDTPHGYLNTSKQNRMIIVVVQTPLPVERVAVERDDVEGFAIRKGAIL